MNTAQHQYIHCPLCGYEFERRDTACAHGCPLGRFCKLVRCPSCSYEFPDETRALGWLQRLFHPHEVPARPANGFLRLDQLREGQQSELVCLNCPQGGRRNALAVYGLVPGSRLVLQQKRPTFVIRVGETELALEKNIAREILVKPVPADPDK